MILLYVCNLSVMMCLNSTNYCVKQMKNQLLPSCKLNVNTLKSDVRLLEPITLQYNRKWTIDNMCTATVMDAKNWKTGICQLE